MQSYHNIEDLLSALGYVSKDLPKKPSSPNAPPLHDAALLLLSACVLFLKKTYVDYQKSDLQDPQLEVFIEELEQLLRKQGL